MIDELIENIESCLLLNQLEDMSDKLTINYIKMSINIYKEQVNVNEDIRKGREVSTNSIR